MAGSKTISDANRMVMMEWNRSPNSLPVEIPDEDRLKFYDDVAEYISAHSSEFNGAANEYARKRLSSDLYQMPLEDTSFDWGMFGNEVTDNAVKITTAGGNVIKNAVYLAVIVLIVVYFMPRIVGAFKSKYPVTFEHLFQLIVILLNVVGVLFAASVNNKIAHLKELFDEKLKSQEKRIEFWR